MMLINPPCKNCSGRHIGCHALCNSFKSYENTKELIKEARKEFLGKRSIAVESVAR